MLFKVIHCTTVITSSSTPYSSLVCFPPDLHRIKEYIRYLCPRVPVCVASGAASRSAARHEGGGGEARHAVAHGMSAAGYERIRCGCCVHMECQGVFGHVRRSSSRSMFMMVLRRRLTPSHFTAAATSDIARTPCAHPHTSRPRCASSAQLLIIWARGPASSMHVHRAPSWAG